MTDVTWFSFQVQGAAETNSSYGSEAVSHGIYDLQRTQVYRQAINFTFYFSGNRIYLLDGFVSDDSYSGSGCC